jgi:hypothetical protein
MMADKELDFPVSLACLAWSKSKGQMRVTAEVLANSNPQPL